MKDMNRNIVLVVLASSAVVGSVWAYVADLAELGWPSVIGGCFVLGPLTGIIINKVIKG